MDTPEINPPESGPLVAPPPGWQHIGYGYPPPVRPTNNLAIAALVVGLVSLFSCTLIGAVAVYLGNRARNEIRTSGEDGDGMALAGVIIGWCAIALSVATVLVLVAYLGFFAVIFGTLAGDSGGA